MAQTRFTLEDIPFAGRSGRGVKIAVLDSGVHATHPHVGGISGGTSFVEESNDVLDRIGHGTAVAAAIREKAPDAELFVAKIFDRQLKTNADTLARAIAWVTDIGAQLINLSLGTANAAHVEKLASAVDYARSHGVLVVSALDANGTLLLPGSLDAVAGVIADWSCERDQLEVEPRSIADAMPRFRASAYPRPIPGVPKERNLAGVSFAVANVTGFLARAIEAGALAVILRSRSDEGSTVITVDPSLRSE